mgnify:CR=1 FL=1
MPSANFNVYTALGLTAGFAVFTWARAAETGDKGVKAAYAIAGVAFIYSTLVAIMELAVKPKEDVVVTPAAGRRY